MYGWNSMTLEEQKRRLKAHMVLQVGQKYKKVTLPNSIEWECKIYNEKYDPNNNITIWLSKHKVQLFMCRGGDYNCKLQLSASYARGICKYVVQAYMSWNSPKLVYKIEVLEGLISKFGELFVRFLLVHCSDILRIVQEPDNDLYPDP